MKKLCDIYRLAQVILIVIVAGFPPITFAEGSTKPHVTLAISNPTPAPGDTVTLTTTVTGSVMLGLTLVDIADIMIGDTSTPYEWTIHLPKDATGSKEFKVVGIIDNVPIQSNSVKMTIMLDMNTLNEILFEDTDVLILLPDSTHRLHLLGKFNDGETRDLSLVSMGTTYSENVVDGVHYAPGDSPVFSISHDGLVYARTVGVADVVATNNRHTTTRRIEVVKPPDILNKISDTDGDGMPDSWELGFKLDVYDASDAALDKDGDGFTNLKEFKQGKDPSYPEIK